MMNAEPIIAKIAKALSHAKIEVVLIGNAAAALQGAPVTTMDFDFLIRMTNANVKKIKLAAENLNAEIIVIKEDSVVRLMNEEEGIIVDFISEEYPPGIKSFASLHSRADKLELKDCFIYVADLNDIINSKIALGRPKDLAVLEILQDTLNEKQRKKS
jgi:hypothetical protein